MSPSPPARRWWPGPATGGELWNSVVRGGATVLGAGADSVFLLTGDRRSHVDAFHR